MNNNKTHGPLEHGVSGVQLDDINPNVSNAVQSSLLQDSDPSMPNDFKDRKNRPRPGPHHKDRDGGFSRKNKRALQRTILLDDLVGQEVPFQKLLQSNLVSDAKSFHIGLFKYNKRRMEISQRMQGRMDILTSRVGVRDVTEETHFASSEEPQEPEEPLDEEVTAPVRPRFVQDKMFKPAKTFCLGAGPSTRSIELDGIYSSMLASETTLEDIIWEFLTRLDVLKIRQASQVKKLAAVDKKLTTLNRELNQEVNSFNDRLEQLEIV